MNIKIKDLIFLFSLDVVSSYFGIEELGFVCYIVVYNKYGFFNIISLRRPA